MSNTFGEKSNKGSNKSIIKKSSFEEEMSNIKLKEMSGGPDIEMKFRATFQTLRKPKELDLPPLKIKKVQKKKALPKQRASLDFASSSGSESTGLFTPHKTNVNFYSKTNKLIDPIDSLKAKARPQNRGGKNSTGLDMRLSTPITKIKITSTTDQEEDSFEKKRPAKRSNISLSFSPLKNNLRSTISKYNVGGRSDSNKRFNDSTQGSINLDAYQ